MSLAAIAMTMLSYQRLNGMFCRPEINAQFLVEYIRNVTLSAEVRACPTIAVQYSADGRVAVLGAALMVLSDKGDGVNPSPEMHLFDGVTYLWDHPTSLTHFMANFCGTDAQVAFFDECYIAFKKFKAIADCINIGMPLFQDTPEFKEYESFFSRIMSNPNPDISPEEWANFVF